MKLKSFLGTLAATAALMGFNSWGQVVQNSMLEGAVMSLTPQADGSVLARVMGTQVRVTSATHIHTPTATITLAQLCDPTRFPGRTQPGFIGGTAIVGGATVTRTLVEATDFFVEPAENVLIGTVNFSAGRCLHVNGTPVITLVDARIPAHPMRNEFGLEVDPARVPLDTPVSAEGFYDGRVFRSFILDVTGPVPLKDEVNPQIGVSRARATEITPNDRKGDRVDLVGGVTMFHLPAQIPAQPVDIYRVDGDVSTFLVRTIATRDPLQPQIGAFTVRIETEPTLDVVLGGVPTKLKLVMPANGTTLPQAVEQISLPDVR
jgi:hypothetical protein